jgi:hypothetical protein
MATSRSRRTPCRALHPVPVGRDRPALGVAVRGRGGRVRSDRGRGGGRRRGEPRPAHHRGLDGLAGGPTRSARAQHSCGSRCTSSTRGRCLRRS